MNISECNVNNDTIAAISTAQGYAGIAIVRMSGNSSLDIIDHVFTCKDSCPSKRPSHTIIHGTIHSENVIVDEVIVLIMRAPHSYTREDVVEVQCHGGIIAARRVLRVILDQGATLADPGEFTKRAFLSGRIDLLQAEAVLDLIQSKSERCAQSALEQLEGKLSIIFTHIYDILLKINADIEATLDFSDEDIEIDILRGILKPLSEVIAKMNISLATWEEGHLLREGAMIVIAGKPNVGKSTLLNLLVGKDRVIVSPTPGTTRDIIEEGLILDGIPLRIIDTAGLRTTECEVEREGVVRARKYLQNADILIYIIDSSQTLDSYDLENISHLNPKRTIVVLNKTDLGTVVYPVDIQGYSTAAACFIKQIGINDIKEFIKRTICVVATRSQHAVISERHRHLLLQAKKECETAVDLLKSLKTDAPVLASCNIRAALEFLGEVTGKIYHDELLDSIFSRFCIGK